MNDEQRRAMFAQMRENATEVNLDSDGVFKKEQPKTDRKIILERQFSRAKEMKDKHDEWQRSQDENSDADEDDGKNDEYPFVILEDGTSVRWTPELEKTMLKKQKEKFERELEKEYGLDRSEAKKVTDLAEKRITNDDDRGMLGESQINENFSSAVAEILH